MMSFPVLKMLPYYFKIQSFFSKRQIVLIQYNQTVCVHCLYKILLYYVTFVTKIYQHQIISYSKRPIGRTAHLSNNNRNVIRFMESYKKYLYNVLGLRYRKSFKCFLKYYYFEPFKKKIISKSYHIMYITVSGRS